MSLQLGHLTHWGFVNAISCEIICLFGKSSEIKSKVCIEHPYVILRPSERQTIPSAIGAFRTLTISPARLQPLFLSGSHGQSTCHHVVGLPVSSKLGSCLLRGHFAHGDGFQICHGTHISIYPRQWVLNSECVLTSIHRLRSLLGLDAGVVHGRLLLVDTRLWAVTVEVAVVVHGFLQGVVLPAEEVVSVSGRAPIASR